MSTEVTKLSIKEFLERETSSDVQELIGRFNTGAFMQCHCAVFAETGLWVDELVPVFQKMDATLAVSTELKVRRLAADFTKD